jgi:hypothetical protein
VTHLLFVVRLILDGYASVPLLALARKSAASIAFSTAASNVVGG